MRENLFQSVFKPQVSTFYDFFWLPYRKKISSEFHTNLNLLKSEFAKIEFEVRHQFYNSRSKCI